MLKAICFTLISMGFVGNSFAQLPTNLYCDTIYSETEIKAEYADELGGLDEYIIREIIPILDSFNNLHTKYSTQQLYLKFTIEKWGAVVAVDFPRFTGSIECQNAMRKNILKMNRWKAAQVGGVPVCSYCKLSLRLEAKPRK